MSLQPEVAAKPLPVDTINLRRYGRPVVTLRAPVTNTEHFYFTVPKTSMQVVLNSLEVHDTRGDTPRVSFPSPMIVQVKPLALKKTSAWKDLLKRHQGAHVELHTRSGPVEGYFLGFQGYSLSGEPSVVLQTDGNICIHEPDSISAVAFKGTQVAKKLERYTSTLCRIHEEDSVYRINITASGAGAGEVCASYTAARSSYNPMFDFSYTIHAEEDADANGNKVADGRTVRSKVRVKCYAVIRNPLHYDLNDVHFVLNTGYNRFHQLTNTYPVFEEQTEDQSSSSTSSLSRSPRRRRRRSPNRRSSTSRSRSPISPIRSRSPSPKRSSPVRSPVRRRPSKVISHESQSDTESDTTSDTGSASSFSTTSMEARGQDRSREWDVPDRISVKEGESVKVPLYETKMEGGIGHHFAVNFTSERAVMLHNSTDTILEPGLGMFLAKGLSVSLTLPCIKPGEDQCVHFRPTGCVMTSTKSSRRGEVLCSRIVDKKLVAKVMWYHKHRYLMHNKEDEHIDVLIDHKSRGKTGRDMQMSARFYPNVSRIGDEKDGDSGEELERYSKKGFLNLASYLVRVGSKHRCAVVVTETEVKLETYSILDCSKDAVAKMQEKKVVGPALVEKLGRLADMKRGMERLKRTGKLYRKQLDGIKSYERGLVKARNSNKAENGENGNKQFFDAVSRAEDSIEEIEEALDKIKWEVVKLMGRMKVAREEICEMKDVVVGSEVNENGGSS